MNLGWKKTNQQGVSVVEVIICLGIAAVIIFSITQALAATHRLDTASDTKEEALALARGYMEIVTNLANQEDQYNPFACICGINTCSGTPQQCTKGSYPPCTTATGYNSCWIAYAGTYHLDVNNQLTPDRDIITDPKFWKEIIITEGTDPNKKQITVKVGLLTDQTKQIISLSTILTSWKNITP